MGVYSLSVHLSLRKMGASLVLYRTLPSLLGLLVSQLGGEDASRVARPPLVSPDTDVYQILQMGSGVGGPVSYYQKIAWRRVGVLRS